MPMMAPGNLVMNSYTPRHGSLDCLSRISPWRAGLIGPATRRYNARCARCRANNAPDVSSLLPCEPLTDKHQPPGRPEQMATRLSFFFIGMALAAWAPLVPFAKARAGLDEAGLGLLLLCLGAGSILARKSVV